MGTALGFSVTEAGIASRRCTAAFLALAFFICGRSAAAADFYVDPTAGAATGDGTQQKPWQTLEGVVQDGHIGTDVHAGDTVWLKAGFHGQIALRNGNYTPPITVAAVTGETPTVSGLSFNQTQGWVVRGLSISPSYAATPATGNMVQVNGSSSNVVVEDCELFSIKDTSSWGANEWINQTSSGFQVSGDHVTVRNNTLTNVRFGISVDGPNALIEKNSIVNFSADGLRGLGDYGVFQYNLVKNVYADDASGDANHDDGFQSWSVGSGGVGTGVVTGVVLRGNFFLNREDPNQKLTNSLQGIGCFDGYFDGWVVENNVVATDHWHGISFYGMRNSRIVNNTVIDVNAASPGPPWIMVTAHKDTTPSENVIVRNNLATDYDVSGTNVTNDHNTTLAASDLPLYFVNPGTFDLHLLPDAPGIGQGSADQAPSLDMDRIPRPQGSAVDLGAYEWHDPAVMPADGGIGGAGSAGGPGAGSGGTLSGSGGARAGTGGAATGAGGANGSGATPGGSGAAGQASGGSSSTPDGGPSAASKDPSGCSCEVGRASGFDGVWAFLALMPLLRRSRRGFGRAGRPGCNRAGAGE